MGDKLSPNGDSTEDVGSPRFPRKLHDEDGSGGLAVTTFTNFTQVMANPNGSKEGEIIKANWREINGGD